MGDLVGRVVGVAVGCFNGSEVGGNVTILVGEDDGCFDGLVVGCLDG